MIKAVHIVLNILAMLAGPIVLAVPCLMQAWEPCVSTAGPYPPHVIDRWKWKPLNAVYGNPEDGVSGQYALIWDGNKRVPYTAPFTQWAPWQAFCWSVWRNSTNQLHRSWGV
jgi:hypothetical protein